ncbi:MAG: hypothetical protein ACD_46C00053G0002 [uncultured bacterium]|nr:MAG: hypothetical protein ACD_46C00053G0002 [uncultured bacterium]
MSKKVIRSWYRLLVQLIILSACCVLIGGASFASPSAEGIQIYQKNVHLSPEHKQKLADDITRYRNADNLWDVLRDEFSLSHYENNPLVQEKIEWYMNNQDFLLRSASRAAPYLYYISQQVRKRHLPAELVLLPIIESGYNPFALSNVGAAGIWQMMPGTASGLGIKRDWWYDGRRDVIASTRAALNYLAYLQSFFDGNWLLAIAAYNTGEGNVLAAIRRNIRDGRDTDFWSLPVAQQTRDYVPSLLALATIISHPDQYPIYFPPVRNAPYLAQVEVGHQINLKLAASFAGISYSKLKQLNPGFNRPSTASNGSIKLVLPIENVEQFSENFAREIPNATPVRWIHYKVRLGDTLASISRKFNTTSSAIRKLNHIAKNSVRHGTNLLIPNSGTMSLASDDEESSASFVSDDASSNQNHITAKATKKDDQIVVLASNESNDNDDESTKTIVSSTGKYSLQPGDTIYMVRSKDSLVKIAKRFHISTKLLQAANKLKNKKLTPGKQLIIPTSQKTTEIASKSSDGKLLPGDTIYMVRRGDTIEKIANRFKTTPAAIRLANLIDNTSLSEGEKLIVPTHLRS